MKFYITKEKYQEMSRDLVCAINSRIEISQSLKKAKEYGDLSENSEYEMAKDQQNINEQRILRLNHILNNAVVIEKITKTEIVLMGSTIKVEKDGSVTNYTIVGGYSAEPENNFISDESPLGKAFLGKKKGECVEINAPRGRMIYQILEIN